MSRLDYWGADEVISVFLTISLKYLQSLDRQSHFLTKCLKIPQLFIRMNTYHVQAEPEIENLMLSDDNN